MELQMARLYNHVRIIRDIVTGRCMLILGIFSASLLVFMLVGLLVKSWPILVRIPIGDILLSSEWHPLGGAFGMLPFIAGSLWVTGIAVILAIPVSIMTAIYLSEYAPQSIRAASAPFVDLLAGIPSVIYGVWGVLLIVPLVKNFIAPLFGVYSSGYTILSGGIVLSIMILPVIIHITFEVLRSIPRELREASLALGATRWHTIKRVVLRKAFPGIAAAIVLGFTRAFGETMAVLMVAGNIVQIPTSPLQAGYPLPSLIANNYGEMMSIPLYDSALMTAALILLIMVIFFSIASRVILHRLRLRIT